MISAENGGGAHQSRTPIEFNQNRLSIDDKEVVYEHEHIDEYAPADMEEDEEERLEEESKADGENQP
jgi:hypothetical protein